MEYLFTRVHYCDCAKQFNEFTRIKRIKRDQIMITKDKTKKLPKEWTHEACFQLVMHAIELTQNGYTAGFI